MCVRGSVCVIEIERERGVTGGGEVRGKAFPCHRTVSQDLLSSALLREN